jgi:putative phage-type endonuclease
MLKMSEQYSTEWFAERRGKATASRIADIISKTRTGWGASRTNYAAQLIAERLTDETQESYTNAAMQWGIDTEPRARVAYEFFSDNAVTEVGFVVHPRLDQSGASPDGLVGDTGLVEIKCPSTATHIATLLSQAVPAKYIVQMQWQMACTERDWCDFVSFDPRMPERLCLFTRRILRDSAKLEQLESDVAEFLAEIDTKIAQLNALHQQASATGE